MSSVLPFYGHELMIPDIVRAEGCHVFDSTGGRYVDMESGVWCTPLGHSHPELLKVMAEQAGRVAHTGFTWSCPVVEEAAEQVLDVAGLPGGKCVFLCSGSEAVEYAVRTARAILDHSGQGKALMLTMADSYFGAYGSASGKHPEQWSLFDWLECGECPARKACNEDCPRLRSIPFQDIRAFLFEPGSSSGLVRFPPEKLITAIAERVRQAVGLILVNEVTTGIGRTGTWFGFEHYGLSPDFIAMGKGVGNGYPVSVAAMSQRTVKLLDGGQAAYAQSHMNDPLGAVMAAKVLGIIREKGLLERCREMSALLLGGLEELKARCPMLKDVRGRGLMAAVELDCDDARAVALHRGLSKRGFLTAKRPGQSVLRIDPPLIINSEEVTGFLQALDSLLAG